MFGRIAALGAAALLALGPASALAQKISALPAGSAVAAPDLFPASQSCTGSPPTATCPATNAVSGAQLKTWAQSGLATVATSGSASDLSAGTLAAARGGAGAITGALKGNGAGVVTQAAAADLSNGVTGSGAVALATSPALVTPALGAATGTSLALTTSLAINTSSVTVATFGNAGSSSVTAPTKVALDGTFASACGGHLKLDLFSGTANTYGAGLCATALYFNSASSYQFYEGASNVFQIDASGNASATGSVAATKFLRPGQALFANLATVDASPQVGDMLNITDASTCTVNTAVSAGGGTLHSCPTVYNGVSWISMATH